MTQLAGGFAAKGLLILVTRSCSGHRFDPFNFLIYFSCKGVNAALAELFYSGRNRLALGAYTYYIQKQVTYVKWGKWDKRESWFLI